MQYSEGEITTCEEKILNAQNMVSDYLDVVIRAIAVKNDKEADIAFKWYWAWAQYLQVLTLDLYAMEHGDEGVDIYRRKCPDKPWEGEFIIG